MLLSSLGKLTTLSILKNSFNLFQAGSAPVKSMTLKKIFGQLDPLFPHWDVRVKVSLWTTDTFGLEVELHFPQQPVLVTLWQFLNIALFLAGLTQPLFWLLHHHILLSYLTIFKQHSEENGNVAQTCQHQKFLKVIPKIILFYFKVNQHCKVEYEVIYGRYYYLKYFLVSFLTELCLYILQFFC